MQGAPESPARAGPVSGGERIAALDTLRGFALLGILVMNINGMALPMAAYFSPAVIGGDTGINLAAWVFAHVFFDLKMLGIFSMLFGAGVIMMAERAAARGRPFARVYYRRMLWLLVIGFLHAYLIWHGDILVTYALCGLLLYLFRNRSPRALIISGVLFLLVGAGLSAGGGYAQGALRDVAAEIEAKVAAGAEMTPRRQALLEQWDDMRRAFAPTPAEVANSVREMRGDAGEVLAGNAREALSMQTEAIPFVLFWRAMGMMLIGMALMKLGALTGRADPGFYRRWIGVGVLVGLPLAAVGAWQMIRHDFDFIAMFRADSLWNYFASPLISMAYVGLVMRLCQTGALEALRARLAAVGRMALTNYLMQSVLAVTIFYGYGFGLFGQMGRASLWLVIMAIWAAQLLWSPWWLARFRFGPMEWLWRTLTYWRRQPFRARAAAA